MTARIWTLILLTACLASAGAREVYRSIAPDGSVQYSDVPSPGAETITLPDFPAARSPGAPAPEATSERAPAAGYTQVAILSPQPGQSIQDNEGNVQIALAVSPALDVAAGHKVQLMLDGTAQGLPTASLARSLTGVDRGQHTLTAQVVDAAGSALLESASVTFFMQRASSLFHEPRPDTPSTGVQQAPRAPLAPQAPRAPHAPFVPAPQAPAPQPSGGGASG